MDSNTFILSPTVTEEEVGKWLEWLNSMLYSIPIKEKKDLQLLDEAGIIVLQMGLSLTKGTKGKLKASNREFEIIDTTPTTSTIKYRYTKEIHEVNDSDLRDSAEEIEKFSDEK